MALHEAAILFGTPVAETILASAHVRAHQQAGHMDASDLIKALQNTLRGGGRPHMGLVRGTHLGQRSACRVTGRTHDRYRTACQIMQHTPCTQGAVHTCTNALEQEKAGADCLS